MTDTQHTHHDADAEHAGRVRLLAEEYAAPENASLYTDDVLEQLARGGREHERDAAIQERRRRISATIAAKRAALADATAQPGDELPPVDLGELPGTELVPVGRVVTVVDMATGEHVAPSSIDSWAPALVEYVTGDLAVADSDGFGDALERLDELADAMALVRQDIRERVVKLIDKRGGKRKVLIGGTEWETNAPTTEVYDLRALRDALGQLVAADVIDADVLEEVIVTPPPKPQEPRVAKVAINRLKAHEDERVREAIAETCERKPQARSLKIVGRLPVVDAVEVDDE